MGERKKRSGLGLRVSGFGFRWERVRIGLRVSGFGFRVQVGEKEAHGFRV